MTYLFRLAKNMRMTQHLALIGMWILSINVFFALPYDTPILTGLAVMLFVLAGLLLFVMFLIGLALGQNKSRPLIAIILLSAIGVAWFFFGLRIGAHLHLLVNMGRYADTVRILQSISEKDRRQELCGDDCLILSEDPMRVGFHFCHVYLNWYDIVYDPSGAVSEKHVSPEQRFNIYHLGGRHLSGNWYLGFFGD